VRGEKSLAARALAAAALPVALFLAVVAQLTVVNRLPLPGGDAPDLVLLLVVAVAVVATPLTGAVTGFGGGLALDVAPPSTHYAGEYALVFCLTGYATARLRTALHAASSTGERDPVTTWTVMVIGAVAGEAGKAAIGRLLSDPDVTNAAIRHVLPGAVCYDLLLSPLVLWLVSRVAAIGQPRPERASRGDLIHFGRTAAAFRLASAGATSGLRLAGTGQSYLSPPPAREPRLRLAGTGWISQAAPPAHRELRLRLAGSGGIKPPPRRPERRLRFDGSGGISQTRPPARREVRLRFDGNGAIANSQSTARREPRLRFDGSRSARPARPLARRPVRLRFDGNGGVAHSRSLPRREPRLRLSGGRAGSARTNHGFAPTAPPLVAGGRASRLNFAANSAPRAQPRRVRTPGRNWLRGASSVPSAGRNGRSATPRFSGRSAPQWSAGNALHNGHKAIKATPGRGWLRPARRKRLNWYTGARSTSWLRRSRSPWRRRRQRLLQLVGGRR
jgi:rod shape-determining protein MreD